MGVVCHVRENSNPPRCETHNVPLIRHESSDDPDVLSFGMFAFYVCPVTCDVVQDTPKHKPAQNEKLKALR
jgi:hypothetical protein